MIEDDREGPGGAPIDFKIGDCSGPFRTLVTILREELDEIRELPEGFDRATRLAGLRNDTMLAHERLKMCFSELEGLMYKMCHDELLGLYRGSPAQKADHAKYEKEFKDAVLATLYSKDVR